jgi:hypothetical protein
VTQWTDVIDGTSPVVSAIKGDKGERGEPGPPGPEGPTGPRGDAGDVTVTDASVVTATGSTTPRGLAARFADAVNVRDYGAVGNCTAVGVGTDDSAAFQAAVDAWISNPGSRLVVPAGRYRIAASVVANMAAQRGLSFEMDGVITPDAGVARAISFIDAVELRCVLKVYGGGTLVDYTTADPVGATEAFYFRGVRSLDAWVYARSYLGRTIRATRQQGAETKTSMLRFQVVETGDVSGGHSRCGQAWYFDDGGVGDSQGAFGGVLQARTFWDVYGPVSEDVSDMVFGTLEGSFRESGLEFRGCQGVLWDKIYIGDTGNEVAGRACVTFKQSTTTTRRCNRVHISLLKCLKTPVGLRFENGDLGIPGIYVGNVFARLCSEVAVDISNARRVVIDNIATYDCGTALRVDGTDTVDVRAGLASRSFIGGDGVVISAGTQIQLNGFLRDGAAAKSLVKVTTTTGEVILNHLELTDDTGAFLLDLPSSNAVRMYGGRLGVGGATAAMNNRPKDIVDVRNYKTTGSGQATVLSGGTSVTVSHGLARTPVHVVVTGRHAETGAAVVTSVSSTQFVIAVPVAVTADRTVFWTTSAERT